MVTLTPFGTEADRRWLRDRLQEAAGISAQSPHGAAGPDSGFLPSGYRSDTLPDGGTRVRATLVRRMTGAGCLLLVALFWNGIVSVFVLAGLNLIRVKIEDGGIAPGSAGYWLFLTPFILVGLTLLGAVLWAALVTEEWRL